MEVTQQEVLIERFWEAVGANGSRADLFGIVRSYKSLHGRAWARLQTMGDLTEEEWEFIADKLPDARRHALLHLADTYGNKHLLKRVRTEAHKEIARELLQGRTLSLEDRMVRLEEELLGCSFNREVRNEVMELIALQPDVALLRKLVSFVTNSHVSEEERKDLVGRFLDTGKLTANEIFALAWSDGENRNYVFPSVIPRLLDMQPSIEVLRGIVHRGKREQRDAACRQLLERFVDDHSAYELALVLGKVEDEKLQEKAWTHLAAKNPGSEALQHVMRECSAYCYKAWMKLRKQKPTKNAVDSLLGAVKDEKTIRSMRRYVKQYSKRKKAA